MDRGTKRSRDKQNENESERSTKKQKGGFRVGPDNLPDGTYRRRAKKIKQNLIDKAKIKKEYSKTKQRLDKDTGGEVNAAEDLENVGEADSQMHPDRQLLLDRKDAQVEDSRLEGNPTAYNSQQFQDLGWSGPNGSQTNSHLKTPRQRQKMMPYSKESRLAEQRRQEADDRRKDREEAERQREMKRMERERFRKAMAKARQPGKDGKRRLGRESKVLLERVQKMMGD